jgi:hypothetical protein
MSEFFPDLQLGRVVVVEEAWWPGLLSPSVTLALEFGDFGAIALPPLIYWKGTFDQNSCDNLKVLMHELVHFRQHKQLGSAEFACHYGMQSVRGYNANRFEVQARRFVSENAWRLDQLCRASSFVRPPLIRTDESWWWMLAG